MAMSVSTFLVCGVKLSDVFRVEDTYVEKTKYDPDTGKPYPATVMERRFYFLGKEVSEPSDFMEWVEKETLLTLYSTGNSAYADSSAKWGRCNLENFVLGEAVVEISSPTRRPIVPIVPRLAEEARVRVINRLGHLGCPLEPSLWLVLRIAV